jgi:hypothetical protein
MKILPENANSFRGKALGELFCSQQHTSHGGKRVDGGATRGLTAG